MRRSARTFITTTASSTAAAIVVATAFAIAATMLAPTAAHAANLDLGKLRKMIVKLASDDYKPAKAGEPLCPSKVKQQAGLTFTCTIPVGGKSLTYEVTQKDGKGNVRIMPTKAVISRAKAVATLKDRLAKGNPEAISIAVDCGKEALLILAPAATFRCAVTVVNPEGTETGSISVKVDDVRGNVTFSY